MPKVKLRKAVYYRIVDDQMIDLQDINLFSCRVKGKFNDRKVLSWIQKQANESGPFRQSEQQTDSFSQSVDTDRSCVS